MAKSQIEGMKELKRYFQKLSKVPQSSVTKGAKKGANIAYKDAKKDAPVDEGNLKKGIILKPEKSKFKGKKVYQVTFNPAMNDIFVKMTVDGERYYYPASQEYGYFTRDGKYIPGYHFMRDSIENNDTAIKETIINEMIKQLDKLD